MDAKTFFDLVVEMRKAQQEYFKYRSIFYLTKAKQIETKVDAEIARVQKIITDPQQTNDKQMELFE